MKTRTYMNTKPNVVSNKNVRFTTDTAPKLNI